MNDVLMREIIWVDEVQDWNEMRDDLDYKPSKELPRLADHLEEYVTASLNDDGVGQAKALADVLVAAAGALYKLTGGDKYKTDDIMLAVTQANNSLSYAKDTKGRAMKPIGYEGPELTIHQVLADGR